MYIFKNALKNLARNKGRNILLGVIMIAILSCVAISVVINTTSGEIIKDYKNRFGSEVYIQPDLEKIMEKAQKDGRESIESIKPKYDLLEKLSKSEYLKETIFTASYGGYSDKLKSLDQDEYEKNSNNSGNTGGVVIGGKERSENAKESNLTINGGLNSTGLEEFKKGDRKIIDGNMPKKDGEAIVSEDFAKLNNLKVGDAFKVQNPDDPDKYDPLELTISGIYYDGTESQDYGFKHPMMNRKNEIITTFDTLKAYKVKIDNDLISVDAKFFLKDPELLSEFNEEAHKLGLDNLYDVSTDSQSYDEIVKPVEGLQKVANIFMILVLCFGGSILILISILGIRERKYEIGVLRAMGMKKGKVALGLIFETLSTIAISLVVGLSIASLSAQSISNVLLKSQIEAQNQSASEGMMFRMGGGAAPNVDPITNLNVHLNIEAIVGITLIALLLGAISIGIGIIYIMRFEPRKILSERN
ncbi:ftsX-like permease family protein [[Clostridium] bifermentans ATCC 638]|uniref:FtsX-like permease family protein n=1 Tax=Paraclostridium bifermentans ATCC 638 = DSM 14991 TaxID=1233171 RepID=T4VIG2_PARBF|nr:FtsX-like permease family protein [Paraclostridium bifermentans]EQK41278.1 ftsX-like permease family protein [[Clostridium] bifermentans ATCC 638] [Paraclostridium bifermentans ATCC 638 = DSM 14991]RIZ58968.1 cell division protein FtsX [Paraclostridium bifermentans]UAG18513.1 FtsX-like permease family protein [Paraclostridium bifermentans]